MLTRTMIAAMCLLCASIVSARPTRIWTHRQLTDESDAVVIGTVDSIERFPEKFDRKLLGSPELQADLTTFRVQAVLKGDVADKVELVHFMVSDAHRGGVINGPNVPRFRKGAVRLEIASDKQTRPDVSSTSEPDYLLFLKRRNDGRYQPVSGYVDSAYSVKLLVSDELHGPKAGIKW